MEFPECFDGRRLLSALPRNLPLRGSSGARFAQSGAPCHAAHQTLSGCGQPIGVPRSPQVRAGRHTHRRRGAAAHGPLIDRMPTCSPEPTARLPAVGFLGAPRLGTTHHHRDRRPKPGSSACRGTGRECGRVPGGPSAFFPRPLSPHADGRFSESSHGFRLGRSAHDAVLKAREYVAGGKRWVVDMDLAKFFDRVNHDVLMARVARKVQGRRGAVRSRRRRCGVPIPAPPPTC